MNKTECRNINGQLLTLDQVCEVSNLGKSTVRRIAEESGAIRRIGRCWRVNREVFFDFIEQNCAG